MHQIEKFSNLPKHQDLVNRAAEVLMKDKRCRGIYVSGSSTADEYSDVDLNIICETEEDRKGMKEDRLSIAQQIGKLKAEAMSIFPYTYVTFYEEEEVKVDFSFSLIPPARRPDKANVNIIYDPEGYLAKMVEESSKLEWKIDLEDLQNKIQHFYMGFSYTVSKIGRGEFWDALDCVDFYRKYLIEFEDTLACRKRENYRRIEKKLDQKRLEAYNRIMVKELTRKNLFQAMDHMISYFDKFLVNRFRDLQIYHEVYAKNMTEFYDRMKTEILELS